MTVNQLIDIVLSGVDNSWSTLHKIRYVYVSLGKLLRKNTDFFFSVDHKLGEQNLSADEIERIYTDDKSSGDLKVICRSAAYILQRAYDELGIKSELIKSNNNVMDVSFDDKELIIHHWFLAVYDEENAYFVTLSSDLPYIQMGMQTKHFATNIPYKKTLKNGEEEQVYCGKEIKHTVLTDKDLRTIDLDIGYINSMYLYDENYRPSKDWHYNYNDASLMVLGKELTNNKFYMELEEQDTKFYNRLMEFKSGDRVISLIDTPAEELTQEDWLNWIKILCRRVHRKIEKVVGYKIFIDVFYDDPNWNYEDWIREICVQSQRYLHSFFDETKEELWIDDDFKYSKWSRVMKKELSGKYEGLEMDNIITILDKTNVLVGMARLGVMNKQFVALFHSLAHHFIKHDHVFEASMNNGIASSKYIAHKFRLLFTKIFACGYETNSFNDMDYSEQIVIIKMIIDKMFPEFNRNNAVLEELYNDNYSIVQNRIQVYSLKHKKTGDYAIVFHIVADDTYHDTYYLYNPKTNKFSTANILKINSDYIIVSDRFKTRIEEMEEIEEKKNKM